MNLTKQWSISQLFVFTTVVEAEDGVRVRKQRFSKASERTEAQNDKAAAVGSVIV